ncbi:TGS domain-containing protein [Kitasatospora aburaviensis]
MAAPSSTCTSRCTPRWRWRAARWWRCWSAPGGCTRSPRPAWSPWATPAAGAGADQGGDELDRTDPARPGWLSRLLEWQQETPDPDAFWSALTADLAGDREITVVTETGETLQLRAGASCVDAAYLLGEETGHRCIGARVNGRLTALSTVLQDGDRIAVLTEQGDPAARPSGPAPDWLAHARTPSARLAIERWLADHPARVPVVSTGPRPASPCRPRTVPPSAAPPRWR